MERGSRHILSQKQILDSQSPGLKNTIPIWTIERELKGYEVADRVVIPSAHVRDSFCEFGFDPSKLVQIPYGTDLKMFPWMPCERKNLANVLMVRTWSWQKGCDTLVEVAKLRPSVPFTHVGSIGDLPFPNLGNLTHHDAVEQDMLSKFYQASGILILLSRQEGLSMVVPQAIASGLLAICSDRTGAADIKTIMKTTERIEVLPSESVTLTVETLRTVLERAKTLRNQPLDPKDAQQLSWGRYGAAYHDAIRSLVRS